MSNIYIQEPPTEGKVLLETTVGDIDIELWSRECPKACRNFIQLCMEGYYDRTIFHRLVKGFIVQGGDPTGTGTGGNSVWGKPFKDEVHSRLRFVRRGLVAMANSGRDDNGSQFFFTLGPTPELQNKHTLFGKVGGNTIFNMIKLEEGDVDDNERPLYPHKILKVKILNNPFEDIVPRASIKSLSRADRKDKKSKSTAAATKNYSLLSFGEEAEEEEEQVVELNRQFSGKSKSSHDLTQDPKLSSELAVDPATLSKGDTSKDKRKAAATDSNKEQIDHEASNSSEDEGDDVPKPEIDKDQLTASAVKEKLKGSSKKPASKPDKKRHKNNEDDVDADVEEYYLGKAGKEAEQKRLEEIRKEYKILKRSMREEKEVVDTEKARAKEAAEEREAELAKSNSVVKEFFEEQKIYKEKKAVAKKGDDREAQTLALLEKFKNKIASAKESCPEEPVVTKVDGDPKPKGILYENVVDDDPTDTTWLAKSLHNEVESPVLAKDANKKSDDWYEIYDPKNPLNRRRREESKRAEGEKWKRFKPID